MTANQALNFCLQQPIAEKMAGGPLSARTDRPWYPGPTLPRLLAVRQREADRAQRDVTELGSAA